MGILQIQKARRSGARVVVMLAGPSGGGKTRTALEIAYGLVGGRVELIGFLDTENRRGRLYADVFETAAPGRPKPTRERFFIADLFAPFTPTRYAEAIREFQAAGVKVLVIDSGTHEWEGLGGCTEIADAKGWNVGKKENKKFMNALLTCDMDVILCLRAREKSVPEEKIVEGKKKLVYTDIGLQAITEKNTLFEATISLMITDLGRKHTLEKGPDAVLAAFGHEGGKKEGEGYITADAGRVLRAWVDGADKVDPEVERWRNILISAADRGSVFLADQWQAAGYEIRKALGEEFIATCKASAAEFDRLAQMEREGNSDSAGPAEDGGLGDIATDTTGGGEPLADDPIAAAEYVGEPAAAPSTPAAAPAAAETPAAAPARRGRAAAGAGKPAQPSTPAPAETALKTGGTRQDIF